MSGTGNRTARGVLGWRLAAVTLGLATTAALAGCGAGQVTQTSSQAAGVNGVNVEVGTIAVRNAELAYPENPERSYPAGADIPVALSIVNQGATDDELSSISSPAAADVRITGSRALPSETVLRAEWGESSGAESSAPESSGAGSSGAESPTLLPAPGSAAPSGTGESGAAVPGEAGDTGRLTVTVTGLTADGLRAGQTLPLTLRFARAGAVTIQVPVANPTGPLEESGHEGGEH